MNRIRLDGKNKNNRKKFYYEIAYIIRYYKNVKTNVKKLCMGDILNFHFCLETDDNIVDLFIIATV